MTATKPDDRLLQQADRFIRTARYGAAHAVLAALRRRAAANPDVAQLNARLALAEGRTGEALAILDGVIATSLPGAKVRLLRAEARINAGDASGAALDAAEAVVLDPADVTAKAILGLALIDLGAFTDAIACLAEAARGAPHMAAAWRGLAEALDRTGDHAAARATLEGGLARLPRDLGLRTATMMAAMRQRDFAGCAALGQAARADGAVDACVLGLLGHALSNLGRHDDASEAYHAAFRLAPEDPYVRHLVAAAGSLPGEARAPADYLETVFDGYAERFETHLIGLGYRIPGLIRDVLVQDTTSPGANLGRVLDLGCGTGLVGLMIADLPMATLTGVDLSSAMLEEARAKEVYAALHHRDALTFLAATSEQWDSVIGGDVLCYFGDLAPLFHALRPRMTMGGRLLFSVELDDTGPGWRLGSQGRYSHTRTYVEATLQGAGFAIADIRREALRQEAGAAVDGLLVLARKAATDA